MDHLLAICLGVSLAAACGFRVFVPLLVVNIAAKAGWLTLSSGFAWLQSDPALVLFLTATVLEVVAFHVPWLDHALDTIAAPAAVVAGTILTASFITGMHPMMQWSLALIAGGGAAAAVQTVTVAVRSASTATTGGAGNVVVGFLEAVAAVITSIAAVVAPVLAVLIPIAAAVVAFFIIRKVVRFFRGPVPASSPASAHPPVASPVSLT